MLKTQIGLEKKSKNNLSFKKSKKSIKGITLIALVITIIVLLILVGVTIATLTGDNGILKRTQEAKTNTEQAEEEELRRLTALEAATNLENYLYEDKNGDTATIPAGFAVSKVDGEKTIREGLVVIDNSGNEFVWIPVNDSIENDIETLAEDENQFVNSVNVNGGFFIGRYETGIKETDTKFDTSEFSFSEGWTTTRDDYKWTAYSQNGYDPTPVIQKNKIPYTWITGHKAQEVASNMYKNEYVNSRLLNISAYKQVINFIDKTEEADSTNSGNYINSSFKIENNHFQYATWDNINKRFIWNKIYNENYNKNTNEERLLSTGASDQFVFKNVYDFIGNAMEYISTTKENCIYSLGGAYNCNGVEYNINMFENEKNLLKYGGAGGERGFRVCLYLK